MLISFLILAHNTPNHLKRLLNSLDSPTSNFYIHLDKKSNMRDYRQINNSNAVILPDRLSVTWGNYSLVEAIILLLKNGYENTKSDYFILLSGSDYPLCSIGYLKRYLNENIGYEFINLVKIPNDLFNKQVSRIIPFKMYQKNIFDPGLYEFYIDKFKLKCFEKMGKESVLIWEQKKYLKKYVPFGGSTWWALTREACGYILGFLERERRFVKYVRNLICPDEMIIQTVLGNSKFRNNMKRNLTYTDWNAGGSHPAWISYKHLDYFMNMKTLIVNDQYGKGELLFARKFQDDSAGLVANIDNWVKIKES